MAMKVKKEIAQRLIAAIENKTHKYYPVYLKTDRGFSILGIICDLVKEEVGLEWKKLTYRFIVNAKKEDEKLHIYTMNLLSTLTPVQVDEYVKSDDKIEEDDTDHFTLFYENEFQSIVDLEENKLSLEKLLDLIKHQWL